MESKYKDLDNNIHQIPEGFEHLMAGYPIGYTLVTDEEAALIIASKVVPPTYAELRATAYPPMQEQLDMQYWDGVNGTTTWQDAIATIKTENPKP
jgi:hypothetical protein